MAFRAPAVAAELFGASAVVGGWALLAGGAFGLRGPVGLQLHRRGLLVLAVGFVVLPLASGRVSHPELDVPCALGAALFCRIGLVKWGTVGEPDPPADAGVPARPHVARTVAAAGTAHRAGRFAARAGTVVGREAANGLPKAARAAGRAIGRARNR